MTEKRTRRPGKNPVPARRDGKARPAPIAPARLVALEALMDVQNSDAYAGLALTRRIASAHLNARDRRLMTELFYGTLENRLCLDHILSLYMERVQEEENRGRKNAACCR